LRALRFRAARGEPANAKEHLATSHTSSAAREQIANGADLIKIFADWTYPTLTIEEMSVIVEEAHKAGRTNITSANPAFNKLPQTKKSNQELRSCIYRAIRLR
jgi:hypothetical protein